MHNTKVTLTVHMLALDVVAVILGKDLLDGLIML